MSSMLSDTAFKVGTNVDTAPNRYGQTAATLPGSVEFRIGERDIIEGASLDLWLGAR